MSTQAALSLGLPPGFSFHPDDDELIELFLLPSVRGEATRFPAGVIIEDDSAANTLPWKLLKRHGLPDDDEAYFFVRTNGGTGKEAAGRQGRCCDGGGTWVSQRPMPGGSSIGGQEIKWRKVNLNLHMGRGKSGSTGWVMHEYTVTEPPCPFVKICHIAFTGHGKERKRVPDDESECQADEQPASKRARVEADANDNGSTDEVYGTEFLTGDEEFDRCAESFFNELVALEKSVQRNREATIQATVSDQDPCVADASAYLQPFPSNQGISSINQELLEQDPCVVEAYPSFPIDQGVSPSNQQLLDQDHYVAHASAAYQPLPTDQGISPVNDQQLLDLDEDPCVAQAYVYQPFAIDQGISPINQQFLDLDQDPCVELGSVYQPFPSDQCISPINQELPDGAYMPMTYQEIQDAQLEPLQSPSWSLPLAASDDAELYLEQVPTTIEQHQPMEHQSEEDQEEQLYWKTFIGIDIDNIIF